MTDCLNHSPEPWSIMPLSFPDEPLFNDYRRVRASDGSRVAVCPVSTINNKPVGSGVLNAERIVACVNAMAGIPDPGEFMLHVRAALEDARGVNDCTTAEYNQKRFNVLCHVGDAVKSLETPNVQP